jgi:uncharacterized membrane protein
MKSFSIQTANKFLKQSAWWVLFLICVFYGVYAFYMGAVEIFSQFGLVADAKYRAAPIMFVVHALSGGVVLITGALQFNRTLLNRNRPLHRLVGKIYVYAIWIVSISAFWNTIFFDVVVPAKISFMILAALWFATTTIAFLYIRKRKIKDHREWMIRSFSLSLFFVTFSFWVPGLTGTDLPYDLAYPLAVFLSWFLNLVLAEFWIRLTRINFATRELSHLEKDANTQTS